MPGGPTLRSIALGAVVVLGLTGCFGGRPGALTAVEEECAAAARVAEGLIGSGGAQDPALGASLVALGDVASPPVEGTANILVPLADVADPTAESRSEWYAALDDLDRALLHRCDFSIRALVADAGPRPDPTDDGGESLEPAGDAGPGTSRPLDWEEIRSRVGDADWPHRGYRGIVGLGPGIHVTVYGVESAPLAMTVCDDTMEALASEAAETEVAIEVHGLDEGLLAQTMSGVCILH